MPETRPTICRLCIAHCGVLATVDNGRLTRVDGDPGNPLFKGYTCPKGRALPDLHNDAGRLLHSLKRDADGRHAPIDSDQAIDEIALTLGSIIAEHGPRSVALYIGTNSLPYPASAITANAFMRAIGSPMFFTSNTIDQPGKQIAASAHGHWLGGDQNFDQADVWMLVGVNPVISKAAGVPGQNPAQKLKEAAARGMQLIVIDPRVSETARRAAIHIRPRPGEDPAILAGMIRAIIDEGLYDKAFVADNVAGFEALRAHVAPFTPAHVADRADIPPGQLIEAARVFASGRRGAVNTGTGQSFSMHNNITEYLALALNSICGRWGRAGERVTRPNAMLPAWTPKAQAFAPYAGWGYGEHMRVRGLTDAACGMPTAALADEILLPGDGQVKALICVGGNPMVAWPDQRKTERALASLDLLVTLDPLMSATARIADYIIAPKLTLETPGMSQGAEMIKFFSPGVGYPCAYAQYSPPVVEPPEGSDVIEEWQFFHGLARRMGLALQVVVYFGFGRFMESPPVVFTLDGSETPDTEQLFQRMCATARIPFDEVAAHPHGHIWEVEVTIAPRDPDCDARLDVGNVTLLAELDQVAAADFRARHDTSRFPFRLIPRRHNNFMNSTGPTIARLNGGKPYNPALLHPDDLAGLGLAEGTAVKIETDFDYVYGIVEADPTLRRGLVAMTHAFGGLVEDAERFADMGCPTNRLVLTDVDYDPLTGMPRMGDIPVRIRALDRAEGSTG